MPDKTVITFDHPDERVIELERLLPLVRHDDELELFEGTDPTGGVVHVVRSSTLSVDVATGELTLSVRLKL
jgi:hypothetical protein